MLAEDELWLEVGWHPQLQALDLAHHGEAFHLHPGPELQEADGEPAEPGDGVPSQHRGHVVRLEEANPTAI